MSEEWRAVVGYEGWYEVSDLGRVRRGQHRDVLFLHNVTDESLAQMMRDASPPADPEHGHTCAMDTSK